MTNSEFVKRAKKTVAKRSKTKEVKDIEKPFVSFSKKHKCKAYKLVFFVGRGFPDRTVLCPGGRILFIEFKTPTGRLSAHQVDVKNKLEGLGFTYLVCDQPGQAERELLRFLNEKMES